MNQPNSPFDENARGVYLITVTPFTEDGELDLESTDRLIDFYLERGVDGLTVLGILGEAPKLTAHESAQYVDRVLARVNGAVPVVVGASAAGFAAMGELTKRVMDSGAAGVMVAPAPYLRSDDQIRSYFSMVNETLGAGCAVGAARPSQFNRCTDVVLTGDAGDCPVTAVCHAETRR